MSSELKPGDLVEIKRALYNHWGVYVGDGFIVHLAQHPNVPTAVSSSAIASSSSVRCQVKMERLKDVAGKDKWRKANDLDEQPRPASVIVQEACAMVGKTLEYKLTTSNCEHFANKLRYGQHVSLQVQKAEAGVMVGYLSVVGLAVVSLVAMLRGAFQSN
ncbi:phospholipase A and acyltransferase 3-like [Neosynchiropus ocellatus]